MLDPAAFVALWRRADAMHVRRRQWDTYIAVDLEIDATAVQFADLCLPHSLINSSVEPKTLSREVLISRVREIRRIHGHVRDLALRNLANGGFPHLPGHLAPDPRIVCVVERAYAFAAAAIAGGTDDTLARTWAAGVVVAHGLPRPMLSLGTATPINETDDMLYPRHTLISEYYRQALEDLRRVGDATRFMDLATRAWIYCTFGQGSPGSG
ncbi:hypothetical protein ACNI3K_08840 [Demequina sp. SO4-13]|uniref:hypothetical protein n=1 Tax=Demequina sp. SO4-13 TaxID=3401027 RepID=UPI003AF58609